MAPFTARASVALWDLGGAAPTEAVARELRCGYPDALGWLIASRGYARYAHERWWLTVKGIKLAGRVFARYREIHEEVAA